MKKLVLSSIVVCGALALAACASPQSSQKQQKTAQQNKMVCFRSTSLGSHIGKTHCMSVSQYKAYKEAQAEEAKAERQTLRKKRITHGKFKRGGGPSI